MKLERSSADAKNQVDVHLVPYFKGTKLPQLAISANKIADHIPEAAIKDFQAKEKNRNMTKNSWMWPEVPVL